MLRKTALFLLGALLLLVALEAVLQCLPVSTSTMVGHYIDPAIQTYPPHHRFTVATGWDLKNARTHRTNNYGFVDDRDFHPDPRAIAVIGDSFIEANMLPASARIGPQLERILGVPVYSMGVPGTSLLDYARRARFAHKTLKIERFVFVIETGDVRQMLCGSGNYDHDCIDPKTLQLREISAAPAGTLKQIVRHSALAQYLFSQLRVDPGQWLHAVKAWFAPAAAHGATGTKPKADTNPVSPALADTLITDFFAALPATTQPPLIVIGTSHARGQSARWNAADMQQLAERATAAGMPVVRLAEAFEQWQARTGLSTAVGPYDGHWNAAAHRVAAETVAAAMGHPAQ
ncbi:hypothetical protein G3580_05600 [Nitrogeniibacter mangrovi]|uniref:SGNH hydrolase-type esterase domain-containing protein n=1 Tax=Nitrogeniibacter mangrovi TaxID=2016596 RepID=A0A6C1B1C4_9RHOO|nr:hypothetical protein [Nitrogeniibacter mangrovi]QID17163.1 hypothetical protein G3580_05600 [Nitrogeniibacter mangrovi]